MSGDGHRCDYSYSAFRALKPITQSHLTMHNENIHDFYHSHVLSMLTSRLTTCAVFVRRRREKIDTFTVMVGNAEETENTEDRSTKKEINKSSDTSAER